jgi:hypothetical protein
MIVGAGGRGQKVSLGAKIPGAGGGAGGCLNNYIDNFSISNHTVTIPVVGDGLYTEFTNSTFTNSSFSLKAQNGSFVTRGSVSLNDTDLIPASSTPNQQGVGGSGGENIGSAPGGSVYTNPGDIGNYLTFLGDELVSNTYFGGGGGSGAGDSILSGNSPSGGNGGGGGGGGGSNSAGALGSGGIGTNGFDGQNATAPIIYTFGGGAFNSIGTGYGGGGGGGGSSGASGSENGGDGGGAMLLLYFQSL